MSVTRSGAAAGHDGYFHELALYGSDSELLDVTIPFIEDGLAAGEPTLVGLGERNTALVRAALADSAPVTFLAGERQYDRPARTIATFRLLVAEQLAGGAPQVRVVGDVPHPGTGGDWHRWGRYEAVVTSALADLPLWGLCPYDTRITPDHVLDDVVRLHPRVTTPAGLHEANDGYRHPAEHWAWPAAVDPVAVQGGPPMADIRDLADPGTARRAADAAASAAGLDADAADNLVVSVSEIVTNALRHGKPPVAVLLWARQGEVACTVTDTGPGPADPFVGLVPAAPEEGGGYGLWIANYLCDRVDVTVDGAGCAVRLLVSAGRAASGS